MQVRVAMTMRRTLIFSLAALTTLLCAAAARAADDWHVEVEPDWRGYYRATSPIAARDFQRYLDALATRVAGDHDPMRGRIPPGRRAFRGDLRVLGTRSAQTRATRIRCCCSAHRRRSIGDPVLRRPGAEHRRGAGRRLPGGTGAKHAGHTGGACTIRPVVGRRAQPS